MLRIIPFECGRVVLKGYVHFDDSVHYAELIFHATKSTRDYRVLISEEADRAIRSGKSFSMTLNSIAFNILTNTPDGLQDKDKEPKC